MSASQVLERFGTFALVRFVLALLVFVLLHLVRKLLHLAQLPVLFVLAVLEGAMSRVDRAVTDAVSQNVAGEGTR